MSSDGSMFSITLTPTQNLADHVFLPFTSKPVGSTVVTNIKALTSTPTALSIMVLHVVHIDSMGSAWPYLYSFKTCPLKHYHAASRLILSHHHTSEPALSHSSCRFAFGPVL